MIGFRSFDLKYVYWPDNRNADLRYYEFVRYADKVDFTKFFGKIDFYPPLMLRFLIESFNICGRWLALGLLTWNMSFDLKTKI